MVGVILPLPFAEPSACPGCCSFSGACHPLFDIRICSGSSRRAAFDVLASVRLRLVRSARVSSLDVLLAVSPRSRAHEVHIPVRVCGVFCGASECTAALVRWKGFSFDTHITHCSLSQGLPVAAVYRWSDLAPPLIPVCVCRGGVSLARRVQKKSLLFRRAAAAAAASGVTRGGGVRTVARAHMKKYNAHSRQNTLSVPFDRTARSHVAKK